MPREIETLKKVEYTNLQEFVELINYNFAVLENSPFFKGVPGKKGLKGDTGIKGVRGIKFFFVDYNRFNTEYPAELNSAQAIDLEFINRKLALGNVNSTDKQKFLNALGTSDLVDGDVIVLTNTKLLRYNSVEFEDTNIAFDSNYGNNRDISEIIREYVDNFINNNERIRNLKNTFELYVTHAKNYQDVSNTLITNSITSKSVFEPYIEGNKKGIKVNTHKYIGFSKDVLDDNEQKHTIIFGSVKKYIKILQNTFAADVNKTLISDYSPGVSNEPSLVILQNDYNSGLMIGNRDSNNFKNFGRIFRNSDNEFVFESNVGLNDSEKGTLFLHNEYLKWNKQAKFERSVEISHNLFVGLDIDSKLIRTGEYSNDRNSNKLELGPRKNQPNSVTLNTAFIEQYSHYINNVLVTDNNGIVLKTYGIENAGFEIYQNNPLQPVSNNFSSNQKILTSNYFGLLITKLNSLISKISSDYWTKDNFNTGVIPNLRLSNQFSLGQNIINNSGSQFVGGFFDILSNRIKLNVHRNKVLVTNHEGVIINDYEIENTNINPIELELFNKINVSNQISSENKILTSKYYSYITSKINKLIDKIAGDYYTKADWSNRWIRKDINYYGNFIIPYGQESVFRYDGVIEINQRQVYVAKHISIASSISMNSLNTGVMYVKGDKYVMTLPLLYDDISTSDNPELDSVSNPSGIATGHIVNRIIQRMHNIASKLKYHVENSFYFKEFWKLNLISDLLKPQRMWVTHFFKASAGNKNLEVRDDKIIMNTGRNVAGNLVVSNDGTVSVDENAGIPYGTIVAYWIYDGIPRGWYLCNGQIVRVRGQQYTTPDLRGKFIMGANMNSPTEGGVSYRTGGDNYPKLDWNQLPPHSHDFDISNWKHAHNYVDTIITDNNPNKVGGSIDGVYWVSIPGAGRANGDADNRAFFRNATTNYNELKPTITHDYYKNRNNEEGGDVMYLSFDFWTLHDNSQKINKKSQQRAFDNRPAHVELCYLMYLGV